MCLSSPNPVFFHKVTFIHLVFAIHGSFPGYQHPQTARVFIIILELLNICITLKMSYVKYKSNYTSTPEEYNRTVFIKLQ